MAIAEIRQGIPPPTVSTDRPPALSGIEIPIPAERLRFIGEGRGIDLRHSFGVNPYRDYEVECFEQKVKKAVDGIALGLGEQCVFIGPKVTDLLFLQKEFEGVRRPDFIRFDTSSEAWILSELIEVKSSQEILLQDLRKKLREEDGFPKFLEALREGAFLKRRIKLVLASIYTPDIVLPEDLGRVRFRFLSPRPQEHRLVFNRWKTPHEVIEPTPELAAVMTELEVKQKTQQHAA